MEKSGIILVYILSWAQNLALGSKAPSISIHPCSAPIETKHLELCCEARGIHSATVNFKQGDKAIATIKYSCDVEVTSTSSYNVTCDFHSDLSIYRLVVSTFNGSSTFPGTWSCGYYANSAYFTLTEDQLLTQHIGFEYAEMGQNATLTWMFANQLLRPNFSLQNPSGLTILQMENSNVTYRDSRIIVDMNASALTLTLVDTKEMDNGTYVYIGGGVKDGITLVVLKKLDPPVISPINVTKQNMLLTVSGYVRCVAVPEGVGPYFYHPDIQTDWTYPTQDVGYNVTTEHDVAFLKNVNCQVNASQPIFCRAREGSGPYSERSHFFPHSLCYYHTTPIPPVTVPSAQPEDNSSNLIAGLVVSVIFMILFMVMFWFGLVFCFFRKKRLGRCCMSFCERFCKCCRRTVCRKCISDDYLDSDSDIDRYISNLSRREESSDWSHIANVYTPGDNPVLRIPRVEQNGRPLPQAPAVDVVNIGMNMSDEDSDTEGESSTDNSNPVNPSQVDVNLNVAGAEGVDRNVIIKEVETGLRNLSKSLSRVQQQVEVTRENLVDNFLNIYADPSIVAGSLHIKVLGEAGSDWGGVSRDIFTSFWNEVSLTYFQGDLVHVPYLPPHRLEEMYKFRLMGRILSHSTAILGYIPIAICKSSMMVTIIDATEIAEEVLLEDFLLFLDQEDRTLLQTAMDNFSALTEEDLDKVQTIFVKFDMGCVLKEDTLYAQVLKMAQNELVIKPRSLCEKMREGIPEVHYTQFWSQLSLEHLSVLYDRLKPTPNKVLACLRPESLFLTDQKRRVYGYLQDFIKTLTERELEKLLQFITGQACVPKRLITVQFSQLSGTQRRPIAHTCSFSIELPETYDSYEDFENEFRILLSENILVFDTQ